MPYEIALPDGKHYKTPVERIPIMGNQPNATFLFSGTVMNSRMRGYCEIITLKTPIFTKYICFYEDGDETGFELGTWSGGSSYLTHTATGCSFKYTVQGGYREFRVASGDSVITFTKREGNAPATKNVLTRSTNQTVEEKFNGSESWFDAVINLQDWEFLKDSSIIGKTERVKGDPLFDNPHREHLPFQIQNTAPAENSPSGIE